MSFYEENVRKMVFAVLASVIYVIVARPETYKFVGSILGLDNYDDPFQSDRDILLYIHSVVMGLLIFILLLFYNPMNAK